MKKINNYITEALKIGSKSKVNTMYHPKDRAELEELVKKLIEERGNNADLNDIDTSEITDMEKLFYGSDFNGDISKWNVSNVKSMYKMFARSKFNGDLSNWDVSKLEKNFAMFRFCPLEKGRRLPKWYHSL